MITFHELFGNKGKGKQEATHPHPTSENQEILIKKLGSRQGCPSGACKKQKEMSILLQCHEFSIQETK
jgi:hypothetical protein